MVNAPRDSIHDFAPAGGAALPAVPTIAEAAGLRRLLAALDPSGQPDARQVCGAPADGARRMVVLPGSFNPPHVAHLALLAAGARAAQSDIGAFLLSVRTVDKEQVAGMLLEDRLWLLCRVLQSAVRGPRSGAGDFRLRTSDCGPAVLASNRGLYVDIAAAVRRRWPGVAALWFVVGYDKIVQIFDRRYYQHRDVALDALFAQASFLVAPRDEYAASDLAALLAQPENRPYAGAVRPLALDSALATVSSTTSRRRAAGGPSDDPSLPAAVRRFIAETGCYRDEAAYGARAAAISDAAARHP